MRRVAITGIGAVTPLGLDVPSTWEAAVAGSQRRRLHRVVRRDSGFPVRIAAEVRGFEPESVVPAEGSPAAGAQRAARRGSGAGGLGGRRRRRDRPGPRGHRRRLRDRRPERDRGAARSAARAWPRPHLAVLHPLVLVDSASGQIAISLGLRGPNYAPVSACATGSHAVGEAAELIRRDGADVVLAGGTESCMHPLILAGFCAMRGLVAEEEDPTKASRPFDATRAGFVMAEGACILVLEDLERAQSRGARIYAEVLGYGASNDAHHMAQPDPESVGVGEMMRAALERSGVAAGGRRLRERARNLDPAGRPGRDARDEAGVRRPRVSSLRSRRRSPSRVTCSGPPARSRRCSARSPSSTACCRRRSTTASLIPTVTSTTFRTRRARVQVDVALSNAMGLGGHNGCVLLGRYAD